MRAKHRELSAEITGSGDEAKDGEMIIFRKTILGHTTPMPSSSG
jgi:hypothetical protein